MEIVSVQNEDFHCIHHFDRRLLGEYFFFFGKQDFIEMFNILLMN